MSISKSTTEPRSNGSRPKAPLDFESTAVDQGWPAIAIVLVNFRTRTWVEACLAGLAELAIEQLLTIVVDNTPEPELITGGKNLTVLHPRCNLGFAGGVNLGIEVALRRGAEMIMLLNPDIALERDSGVDRPVDFLTPLVAAMRRDSTLAVVAPTLVDADASRSLRYAGGRVAWWRGGPKHLTKSPPREAKMVPTQFCSGAAMLIRREAIDDVGLLETSYFLYFEDADYCQRCLARGWQLAWVPEARLIHSESCSIDRRTPMHAYLYARSRLLFLRRWSPAMAYVGYSLFVVACKIPLAFVLLGLRRGFAFSCGVIDGLRGLPHPGRMP